MSHLNTSHDDMNWTTVSSEYIFRQPWLTVRRDHVRLPNGTLHLQHGDALLIIKEQ